MRDLAVIVLVQICALTYGMHTVFIARPVALVFEVDRFRVVAANQVLSEELPKTLAPFNNLSLTGPRVLGARNDSHSDTMNSLDLALQGFDIGQRPSYWEPYKPEVAFAKAHPIGTLIRHYPNSQKDIETRILELGLTTYSARFLPLVARVEGYVVVLNADGNIAGFMPYDGF